MKKYNVLIFPAGSENAINIFDSLRYNLHFDVYGASSISDYAKEIYKEDHYYVGNLYISDEHFNDNFNRVLDNFHIDFIIPTHDTIVLYLMENEDKIHASIISSPLSTVKIAHSKKAIYSHLKGKDYCPRIYDARETDISYPVFLKPDVGVGGKGVHLANNKEELINILNTYPDLVICENLPFEELTVDCFTDYKGRLLFIGPRTRERITMGISFLSKKIDLDEEIKFIGEDLNKTFTFRGAWFFQIKKDEHGKYKLLEFSTRASSTMALYRMLGINFTLLSLFDALKEDVSIIYNDYPLCLNRRLSNAYTLSYEYDEVYIDFDDTLVIDGMVNTMIISLIYQLVNKKKKIYLLTKHSTDIYEDLKKYKIDASLFTKIFSLSSDEDKADYITSSKAIFIDNYFPQRKSVFDKKKIAVFDVDAAECLIDHSNL